MKTIVLKDPQAVAERTADMVREQLIRKPHSLLCFAAGHTQKETLELLAQWYAQGQLPFDQCRIVGLDEWVGLPGTLPGTCLHFINQHVLSPMHVGSDRFFFFDGCATDLDVQCQQADAYLDKYGPIDLVLLGVGMNAHLAFNEPGSSPQGRSHHLSLCDTSKTVGAKYFETAQPLTGGITLGLGDLFAAQTVIVQLIGAHKAPVAKTVLEGPIHADVPASLARNLPGAVYLLDEAAAAELTRA